MAAPIANVSPQLRYNAAWNIHPVLAVDRPTVIDRGYTEEGTIRPGHLSMRVNDNAAPTLNPSRPASLLYGITGRGMGAAISADSSLRAWMDTFLLDPDQTPEFSESPLRGKRWLDVEAYGPLYRIGQWSDELQPPMTRTFLQYSNLIGFWPGDDPALSTRAGIGRSYANVTLADVSAPLGAAGSFLGTSTTSVVLSPLNASTTAGFQVTFCTKMPSIPVSPAVTQFFSWRANGLFWSMEIDTGGLHVKLYSAGVLLDDWILGLGGTNFLNWVTWRAKIYQSGANVVLELGWFEQSTSGLVGSTRSVAATLDRLTSIRITGNALVNGTRYAQIAALTTVADDLQSFAALQSFEGYRRELTTDRFTRLLVEAGLPRLVLGTSTTRMGAQKPATLMDLLREIAATEDGLIFDKKDAPQVVMRTRRHRMNQTAVMTLAASDIVPPFKERVDNVSIQNFITITDRGGTVAAASKSTGPMSVQAYPDGIGVFKGGAFPDVDVNLNDPATDLAPMVAWYLARGTVPGPRFPSVTIEVGMRSPGLRTAAKALEIGDRILVTGRLADPIDLHVIGVTETIETHKWFFLLTCIPGDVFDVGAEDDTGHRLDAYASTVITPPTPATTGTAIVVGSPDPNDVWSTTSLPYPIVIAGERMTVTACTAAALVSGTWRQTLTVTRSVNGIVKAQVAGSAVRVTVPYREVW